MIPLNPSVTSPAEMVALAEVIKLWLPGLKGDPAVIAGTMRLNLLKRGVALVNVASRDELVGALAGLVDAIDFEGNGSIHFSPGTPYERDALTRARTILKKMGAP